MTAVRWDLFDNAVKLARKYVRDEDAARDVALKALTEVLDGPDSHVMQCVKRRAQDAVRTYTRQPFVANLDMDQLAASDDVVEQAAYNEHTDTLVRELGSQGAGIVRLKEAGFSDADIGRQLGISEPAAMMLVAQTNLLRTVKGI